jgi:hypothetical protein
MPIEARRDLDICQKAADEELLAEGEAVRISCGMVEYGIAT